MNTRISLVYLLGAAGEGTSILHLDTEGSKELKTKTNVSSPPTQAFSL